MAQIDCRGPLGNVFCILSSADDIARQLNQKIDAGIDRKMMNDYFRSSNNYDEVKEKIVSFFKDYHINIEYIEDESEYDDDDLY